MSVKYKSEEAKILAKAREILRRTRCDNYIGICLCVKKAVGWEIHQPTRRILKHIKKLLGKNCVYLQDWLVRKGHVRNSAELNTLDGAIKLRQTRLNWIKDMIQYWERKAIAKAA